MQPTTPIREPVLILDQTFIHITENLKWLWNDTFDEPDQEVQIEKDVYDFLINGFNSVIKSVNDILFLKRLIDDTFMHFR